MSKKSLFAIILILCASFGLWYFVKNTKAEESKDPSQNEENFTLASISFENTNLKLEVADTNELREKGLSDRETLAHDGMIFIFDRPSLQTFWMKDMKFNIDIVWVDDSGEVIQINENVSRFTYNSTYPEYSQKFTSELPVKYVIELEAGKSKILNLKVGTQLDIKN
jgi:uncharacterized membrane protein (UPF0127 family)